MGDPTRWLMALLMAISGNAMGAALPLGQFAPIRFEPLPGARPFFLVSTDSISQAWVRANAAYFRERAAMGYVIAADSPAAFEALRKASAYQPLVPLEQAGTLIEEYALPAYPVFVDPPAGVAFQ